MTMYDTEDLKQCCGVEGYITGGDCHEHEIWILQDLNGTAEH